MQELQPALCVLAVAGFHPSHWSRKYSSIFVDRDGVSPEARCRIEIWLDGRAGYAIGLYLTEN
ncbi:hypothetical protein D779_1259 [Imhoffiella purpurea]|uniref:Uncharacterized protein n=1 Tax=Imhoffiella purpurea TaxID=1249627 RepID=W9VHJ6_9GAMM|nr:hypothetical protein D779_1259 [Imhoffiella purpurea]